MSFQLIATAAFGLEAVTARELKKLGYESSITSPGRIEFTGDLAAICETNLWLRTADRVLVKLADGPVSDFDALFEMTESVEWEAWMPADAGMHVVGKSVKSQLTSVPACQRTVKKALVNRMQSAHQTEDLPETGPSFQIEVALLKDQCQLTLDTTGPSLHKRGYRTRAGVAPLKETLAAALVQLSYWRPDRPLVDPFCGAGSILVEAAMIGRNMAPGLKREFAAEAWPIFDNTIWSEARQRAESQARPDLAIRLEGYDTDGRSLHFAREAAERAGVAENIHFQQRSFEDFASSKEYGSVITNPPYAIRLGEHEETKDLYESLPVVLRNLPTWSHYILTAFPVFEKLVGREANRRRKLYNGRIECTYYQFYGPKPYKGNPKSEEVRSQAVFGGVSAKSREQAELFATRLKKRARHLRRWPTKKGITCFRLYDRDIPEIPLVVDRYEDCLHITEYERPHDRAPAEHADWLELMQQTAATTLEVEPEKAFLKTRRRQRGTQQHQKLSRESFTVIAQEGGLNFYVNLSDYVDTGLFLDHRITRGMVREQAAGKRFLNLFAYTGAFTVYAAAGGAIATTSVDTSATYLDWAEANLELNQLTAPEHDLVRADVMTWLREVDSPVPYDLMMIDPPTFSNSKSLEEDWDVQAKHVELLTLALGHLAPGGTIYFSTNFRRFKLDEANIPATFHEISRQTVPEDFRNQRIHRCWRMEKK